MSASRIPSYDRSNPDSMLIWFAEMAIRDLLFHPEEEPQSIINLANDKPLFSQAECEQVSTIMADMFNEHGDGVIEACCPIFMRKAGQFRALN